MLADHQVLAALRGEHDTDEVCQTAGVPVAAFTEARAAWLRRLLPDRDARIRATVQGPVEILDDRAGVPHIYAGSTPALYFGLGFAMARDRLWQMDRLRRRALGTQAEVLGPAYIKSDLMHRTVGIGELAVADTSRVDERTRAILDAFVGGINCQIEQISSHLPPEFALLSYEPQPFSVADVLTVLRGMWWSLNGRIEGLVVAEAARLLPTDEARAAFLTPEAPEERIVPPGSPYPSLDMPPSVVLDSLTGMSDATGSNNWAVGAGRSTSGHAMLCSDPHQGFWLPASWYEYGVHGPEDDAAGAGHPGVPGLWWGANGDIAWGLTNNAASTRDLYKEEVDPRAPHRYRDGDVWRAFTERQVTIEVRGQQAQHHTLKSSVRGPIVNAVLPSVDERGDPPLSLRWVGQEHLDDVRAAVAIGRARDWNAFRNALRDWSVAVFNFVYADRTGRVGYQCAGRIPIRGRNVRGYRDANHPADAWQSSVPFDALPQMENPARGYVASANNRVVADDYPYPLHGAWGAGHRATRLRQALERPGTFDRDEMIALQNDVKGCRAERLCPPLLRRLAAREDADCRLVCDILGNWGYRYMVDSPAPLLFETLLARWQERVAAEYFPDRLVPLVRAHGGAAARLLEAEGPPWFPHGTDVPLADVACETVAELRQRFGHDTADWAWGVHHQAYWKHPLSNEATGPAFDVGPVPVDGCGDTVRNTGSGTPPYGANSGAEYRMVVDFADPTRFLAIQNVGNSGQPGSPHYADQFASWIAGDYHTVCLRRADVEQDAEARTLIEPREV